MGYISEFRHPQWGSISGNERGIRVAILKDEVEVFTSRLQPHDTGHLHTTISTLNNRIEELENEKETSGETR